MTVLPDYEIAHQIYYRDLTVKPCDMGEQLQPCSLDIRIGDEVSWYEGAEVVMDSRTTDPEDHLQVKKLENNESVLVEPGDFFLFSTEEYIEIPDYLECEVRGRSSFGRLGLEVHSTAGLVDAGFEGKLVLEVSNNSTHPVRIYRGDRVAQLVFNRMSGSANTPYGEKDDSKYQKQEGAVGSRVSEDHA